MLDLQYCLLAGLALPEKGKEIPDWCGLNRPTVPVHLVANQLAARPSQCAVSGKNSVD